MTNEGHCTHTTILESYTAVAHPSFTITQYSPYVIGLCRSNVSSYKSRTLGSSLDIVRLTLLQCLPIRNTQNHPTVNALLRAATTQGITNLAEVSAFNPLPHIAVLTSIILRLPFGIC